MDPREAVAATVYRDHAQDRWMLTIEGSDTRVLAEFVVPWDGSGAFLREGLDAIGPLLNGQGLAYRDPWTEYGDRWVCPVHPLASWGRPRPS